VKRRTITSVRFRLLVACALVVASTGVVAAAATGFDDRALDAGFRDMYNLQFEQAHRHFAEWQSAHPEDPMGPVGDAAAYLFAELDRLHILELEFFVDDKNFDKPTRATADPILKQRFASQLDRAHNLAQKKLANDAHDANAALAEVLMGGLRGDYAALIEKRNFAGLSFMKQSRALAENLVAAKPDAYDAYLAIGVENYLLSLKAAPLRWLLHVGGAETDRVTGLKNLSITAEKGHYLAPFARLLLAIAAVRDGNRHRAKELLQGLAAEFPKNRLYLRELAQLR
jgi:hypothetical protein